MKKALLALLLFIGFTSNSFAQCNAGAITAAHDTICYGNWDTLWVTGSTDTLQWQASIIGAGGFMDAPGGYDTMLVVYPFFPTEYRVVVKNGTCYDTSAVYLVIVGLKETPIFGSVVKNDTLFAANPCDHCWIYQHCWSFGDGHDTITAVGETAVTHVYDAPGTYQVCLTYCHAPCADTAFCQTITVLPSGIHSPEASANWSITPNVLESELHFTHSGGGSGTLQLLDVTGRAQLTANFEARQTLMLNTSGLPAGIYLAVVREQDRVTVKRVVVR